MKAFAACVCAALLGTALAVPGGINGADTATQEVADAAAFAVQQINMRENSMFANVLSSVTEASSQVVAGVKYILTVEAFRSTECRNDGAVHTLCSCAVDDSEKHTFRVEVLSQPWMTPSMELLSWKEIPAVSANSVESAVSKSLTIATAINSGSPDYQSFLKTFTPSYCNNAAEISKRSEVFETNMRRVKKLQEMEKGSATYGVTKFSDISEEEFKKTYAQATPMEPDTTLKQVPPVAVSGMPDSFDWRDHNAVTPIKNQGKCGSCWSFSTTGNVEGQWAIKKGKLISLSEQELVDCDKVDHGCEGGLPSNAYAAIMKLGGLTTESQYPYTGRDGTCHFQPSTAVVNVNGSVALPKDEEQLAAWLATNGPISIGINASPMQLYTGGISHPWKLFCNPEHLDHGVLIVGYGKQGTEPFWIIKNSWGATWGEKGYYRVYRGAGVCGLNRMATSCVVN